MWKFVIRYDLRVFHRVGERVQAGAEDHSNAGRDAQAISQDICDLVDLVECNLSGHVLFRENWLYHSTVARQAPLQAILGGARDYIRELNLSDKRETWHARDDPGKHAPGSSQATVFVLSYRPCRDALSTHSLCYRQVFLF